MRTHPRRGPLLALAALATLGCDDGGKAGRVTVHPSAGRVLYRGKPLADALLVFAPAVDAADPVPTPTARTDAEGNFRVHTYVGDDGAPAGTYRVGLTLSPARSEVRDVMRKGAAPALVPPAVASAIAARYADPARSGLEAKVAPGDNAIPPFVLD